MVNLFNEARCYGAKWRFLVVKYTKNNVETNDVDLYYKSPSSRHMHIDHIYKLSNATEEECNETHVGYVLCEQCAICMHVGKN